jgi:hypothetical protein
LRLFSALRSATYKSYCTRKWGGYLEGGCFQRKSLYILKSKILSWLTFLVMRPSAV